MIARAGALCLALVTAAGCIAAADRLPALGPALRPPGRVGDAGDRLAIPAATATLTCPGPETAVAPDGSAPLPDAGPFALTAVAAGTDAARAHLSGLDGGPAAVAQRTGGGAVRVLERDGNPGRPLRLAAAPAGPDPTSLAAVQATLARGGDRRGLVAAACPAATADAWLVGSGTAPGRRARLLLANPTPAPAVVDVLVAGPSGPVATPSARGLVVAPGRVRAVQLDALVPGLARLAVHVVARRGRVASLLYDSALEGTTPAGVDDVPVAAPAARQVTVPGLVVAGVPGAPPDTLTVRLAAPGGDDAVVRVHLSGPAGDVQLPGGGVVTVPAGGVADVPVPGLVPGAYAALAEADVPIVAGAVVRVAGPPSGPLHVAPADVGWAAGAPALRGDVVAALPRPIDSRQRVVTPATGVTTLALTAAGQDADVVVRQIGPDGAVVRQRPAHVAARRTVGVDLGPDAAALELVVHGGQEVWAGVGVRVSDRRGPLLALLPLTPTVTAATDAPLAVPDPWLGGPPAQSSSLP
ncbi:MAG TPA: DUF5719 family protein [Kineosporiaceae bacterium]|nr:DUF5719 family protein [Kineosporiaceae bacterium]